MQLWQPFDSQAKHCLGLGLLTFVQGGMYHSLGMIITGGGYSGNTAAIKAALVTLVMIALLIYIIFMVFESIAKFRHAFTKWSIMLLFSCAPIAAYFAAVFPQPSWVWTVLAPGSCLFHCALFVVGYNRSFAEMKMPSEITQKFITGPNGQQFAVYSHARSDLEVGQKVQRASDEFDLQGVTCPEHEARAAAVRDGARRAVRGSMLLASLVWFCVFLADLRDSVRRPVAMNINAAVLQEVPLTWDSDTVYPHAFVYAGGVAFAANEYQVFRIDFTGEPGSSQTSAHATLLDCTLDSTIADVTAKCDATGECQPLVLLNGEGPAKVVNCVTGEQSHLSYNSASEGRLTQLALHAEPSLARPLHGPMLAVLGDDVVEYSLENESDAWAPRGVMLQVNDGSSVRGIDYQGNRLYLFERSKSVSVWDLDESNLKELGRWAMPPWFPQLAAGSAMDPNTLYLLPEGPEPHLYRWSPPTAVGR
jgi:hypothetical protein